MQITNQNQAEAALERARKAIKTTEARVKEATRKRDAADAELRGHVAQLEGLLTTAKRLAHIVETFKAQKEGDCEGDGVLLGLLPEAGCRYDDPDYDGAAFFARAWDAALPTAMERPPLPFWEKPVASEGACTYVVTGRRFKPGGGAPSARCVATGERFAFDDGHVIRQLWEDHVAKGTPGPCIVGVRGHAGKGVIGGQYASGRGRDPFDVVQPEGSDRPVWLRFVGLSDDASVTCFAWGANKDTPVLGLEFHNIGLRGETGRTCTAMKGRIGLALFDGTWDLPPWEHRHTWTAQDSPRYRHGKHIRGAECLVVANNRNRGETPDQAGMRYAEHRDYHKETVEHGLLPADVPRGLFHVHNETNDTNRTNMQHRPERAESTERAGDVVVAGNLSIGQSTTFDVIDGGMSLSVWSTPDGDPWVFGNVVLGTDSGGIGILGQAPDRNVLTDDGFVHGVARVFANKVTAGPRTRRELFVVTACRAVLDYGGHDVKGGLTLDNEWAMERHKIRSGSYAFEGEGDPTPLQTWSGDKYASTDAEAYAALPRGEVAVGLEAGGRVALAADPEEAAEVKAAGDAAEAVVGQDLGLTDADKDAGPDTSNDDDESEE
ncbi:MAG: hypothetical protein AAFP22_09765 [Planctomycetota bacterium]